MVQCLWVFATNHPPPASSADGAAKKGVEALEEVRRKRQEEKAAKKAAKAGGEDPGEKETAREKHKQKLQELRRKRIERANNYTSTTGDGSRNGPRLSSSGHGSSLRGVGSLRGGAAATSSTRGTLPRSSDTGPPSPPGATAAAADGGA